MNIKIHKTRTGEEVFGIPLVKIAHANAMR